MRSTLLLSRFALTIAGLLAATAALAAPLRLPTDVVPVFQQIHLKTDADSAEGEYCGHVHHFGNGANGIDSLDRFRRD